MSVDDARLAAANGTDEGIEPSLVRAAIHELCTPLQYVEHSARFLRRVWPALRALLDAQAGSASPVPVRLAGLVTVGDLIAFLDAEVPDALDRVEEGVGQLEGHLRTLGQLARKDADPPALHDLNQLVGIALAAAHGELKYVATVELVLGDVPLVQCQPGSLIRRVTSALVATARSLHEGRPDRSRHPAPMRVVTHVDGDRVAITIGGAPEPGPAPRVVHIPINGASAPSP
jgi:signal transduction histidine kinase